MREAMRAALWRVSMNPGTECPFREAKVQGAEQGGSWRININRFVNRNLILESATKLCFVYV